MTVTYTGAVPNGSTFGCFWKVLGIWRGSVYKLVWRELLAYLLLYYTINFLYRFGLNDDQRRAFERVRIYFGSQSETIPMSFVLGFYVTLVVNRWWDQYKLLPWPDTLALFLNAGIPGADETQRLMRRNIVRYAILAYVITLQRVSLRVKKRFPTWQHVVDCGLMLESEKKIFELMDNKTPMSKYWMPLVWATNIINRARKDSFITSDHIVQTLLTELSDIRRRLGALIGYDTVNVPLVYTQVVTLALYTYFVAALIGRQFVPYATSPVGKFEDPDMFFPFFTSLQFCFYVGWLKVAEVLINPFGEDDDDIELNWLIDRHIKAGYMIVDEMHEEHPELLKDQFWEEVVPKELPYTVASEHYRKEEPKGSADNYKIKHQDAMYANLVMPMKKGSINDDVYADYESVDTPIVERRKGSISWFQRQLSRTGMGSVRSSSTAYSSGGLFGRPRGNSIDIHAENGQVPGCNQKMTIYDRLVGRRSGRNQRHRSGSKSGQIPIKPRPRIPTPDVTKEVIEREIRFPTTVNVQTTGVPMKDGGPILQMILSPIQETDGSGSVNSTLHATQPGAAALASAILSHGVRPVLMSSPILDREFTQPTQPSILTTLFEKPTSIKSALEPETILPLQEFITAEAENEVIINSESQSQSSTCSNTSQASKASKHTDATVSLENFDVSKDNLEVPTLNPCASAPSSLTALVPEEVNLRKTSVISQGSIKPNSPKRGEVYV